MARNWMENWIYSNISRKIHTHTYTRKHIFNSFNFKPLDLKLTLIFIQIKKCTEDGLEKES